MRPYSGSREGFRMPAMPNLSLRTAGRRPKAAGEGTRGELGAPGTARRYEDLERTIGMREGSRMTG